MHYIYKVNYAPIVIVKRSSQFKDLLLILIVDMHLNYLHQNFITYFIPQRIATKISLIIYNVRHLYRMTILKRH